MKKAISLLLTFSLLFSILSFDAIAVSPSANVCEIVGGSQYASLDEALAAVQNGQTVTIRLLQNITYNNGISISYDQNKQITFDLNGYTLSVLNTNGAGLALASGKIDYFDNTSQPGQFNVTGTTHGVYASGAGVIVKVTNATATAPSLNNDSISYGVFAQSGAQIEVTQNAAGNKYGAYADEAFGGSRSKVVVDGDAIAENITDAANPRTGAIATNYADIEVKGNASGGYHGVYAGGSSTAKVWGNVSGGMYGALAELTSTVEVVGNVEATQDYGAGAYNRNDDSVITVGGNSITDASTGIGAIAAEGSVTIEGTITASAATYVRVGTSDKIATDFTTDAGRPGYRKYTDGNGAVWVKDITPNVCEIDGTGYATLGDALSAVQNGQTAVIKLLDDITCNLPIVISNRNIIFDLNGNDLIVDTLAIEYSIALKTENGGKVSYTGSGSFVVKGYWCGVFLDGGEVSVTSAYGILSNPYYNNSVGAHVQNRGKLTIAGNTAGTRWGVYAENGSEVTIGGDATSTAELPYDSCGAQANSGAIITITGNTESKSNGIYVSGLGSEITVGSVVSTTTGNSRHHAVHVENYGQAFIRGGCSISSNGGTAIFVTSFGEVTIDGAILHNGTYIDIYQEIFSGIPEERTIPTTKAGYHTYSTENGTVWVKDTSAPTYVCEVDGTGYTTLEEALRAVSNTAPKTIKLLENITHTSLIHIDDKRITFDLNGNNLVIDTSAEPDSTALIVVNEASVDYTGSGEFNVIGDACGVLVRDIGSSVAVTNVQSANLGVHARDGGTVKIEGSLTAGPTTYIKVGTTDKGAMDYEQSTTLEGYHTYTDNISTVWVKAAPAVVMPGVQTNPATDVATTGVTLHGSVSSDGGAVVTERGFVYGTNVNPAIGTDTKVSSGSGTGSFSETITGLTPNTTYYVRAYAINSAGTSYGADVSFTTLPEAAVPAVSQGSVETKIDADINGGSIPATQNTESGVVSARLNKANTVTALEKATETGVVAITFPRTRTIDERTPVSTTITGDAMKAIAESGATLSIDAPSVSIAFDPDAVSTIAGAGEIQISAGLADSSALTSEQKAAAGDRPVYDFTVMAGGKTVSEFGGSVSVLLPYTLKSGEDPNAIVICYIDTDGNVQTIRNGKYDPTTGRVSFVTNHFSLYMIGYNAVIFDDVGSNHTSADYITFVAARGIFNGTGNGKFTPDGSMTRAMFITAIANLDGADLPAYKTSRYNDVAAGQWYTAPIEWAADNSIVSGYSGKFDPNAQITLEQIAVILHNYMRHKGISVPEGSPAAITDESNISPWALDAVRVIFTSGIIIAKSGTTFDPKAIATRAEAAAIFARFLDHISGRPAAKAADRKVSLPDINGFHAYALLPGIENGIAPDSDDKDE